jgi:RNA polymerase sigma-70 factor (ECF subfamily)
VEREEPLARRDLLERFRAGERAALEAVYRHHAPDVARHLRHGFTLGRFHFAGYSQPFDLDNAVQETFARAFKESARVAYDGLRPFGAWLFSIARNLVIDDLRERRLALEPFLQPDAEAADAAPEEELLRHELRRLYYDFVEQLDGRERAFFLLRFEEQRTQVEAGRACGLSHMQARTREKRLRRQFLAHMQRGGYLQSASVAGLLAPALLQ